MAGDLQYGRHLFRTCADRGNSLDPINSDGFSSGPSAIEDYSVASATAAA